MSFLCSDCDSYCCRYQISPKEETSASACSPARFPQGNFQFALYDVIKNVLLLCACSSFYAYAENARNYQDSLKICRTLRLARPHSYRVRPPPPDGPGATATGGISIRNLPDTGYYIIRNVGISELLGLPGK